MDADAVIELGVSCLIVGLFLGFLIGKFYG
jgi:hypothetical protein